MKYQKTLWSNSLDISIRDEVIKTIEGDGIESGRGKWVLLRKVLRDSNDQPIDCLQCKRKGYRVAMTNHVCDRCFGVGYLWKEEWQLAYRWSGRLPGDNIISEPGSVDLDTNTIYLRYDSMPRHGDKIIEVHTDLEGVVIQPYVRKASWDIVGIDEHDLDHGRKEYWRVRINRETQKYFGQPLNQLIPNSGSLPK